ncbi:ABC transporter permease [Streptomyces sp. NPDC020965]|uniref:ABC transporter permease n=1 Tax=Streptomyces sp. NPDC020965 TaxID=3365105 RepID=UPI0037AA8893
MQARAQLVYRSDFLFGLGGLLLQIYLLKMVWTAVFPSSGAVAGEGGRSITLATQIAYATLAGVQYWLFNPAMSSLIPDRIREGSVIVDLVRPVRFTAQALFAQFGTTLAMAPFAVCALPFAVLVGGMQSPESTGVACVYAVSLALAYLVNTLLSVIVVMGAFWVIEIGGIYLIFRMVSQLLSGALVPLWFMPDWLAESVRFLPFHATTFTPISLYLGQAGGAGEMAAAIGVQVLWVVILWIALRIVWSRALRRVVVQGG